MYLYYVCKLLTLFHCFFLSRTSKRWFKVSSIDAQGAISLVPVLQGAQQEDAAAPKKAKKTKEATPIANAENANAADEVPTATATPIANAKEATTTAAPKTAKKTKEDATAKEATTTANAADEVPTATATPIANNAANAADEVPTATATPIANAAAVPTATATPIPHASIVEDLVESDTEEEVRDHCTGVS